MSDTRFKWLVVAATVTIITVAGFIFLPHKSVGNKISYRNSDKVGEYVYVDIKNGTLHVNRKCSKLNYKDSKSIRINPSIIDIDDYTFCPSCVSDEQYEQLTR